VIGGIFFYALFFPSFHSVLGTAGAILVNGGILALASAYVLLLKRGRVRCTVSEERAAVFGVGAIMLYYLAAILFAAAFLSEHVIVRDLYEAHRPVLYLLVFLLPFFLIRKGEDLRFAERWLVFAFFAILLIGANQFARLVDPVSELYTKTANISSGRIAAPFGNPYDYAFVMVFFFLLFVFKLLWTRRLVYVGLCAISIAGVLLPQSRAVFGAFVVAGLFIVPLVLCYEALPRLAALRFPRRLVWFTLFALGTVGAGAYVFHAYGGSLRYLVSGYERIVHGEEVRSLSIRQAQFAYALDRADESLVVGLFGNGPSKAVMEHVESIYTYHIFRYGFVGFLLVFVAPLLLALTMLFSTVRRSVPHKPFLLAILCWLLVMPVASIGNNFVEQFRISFLYYFLLGVAVRTYFVSRARPLPSGGAAGRELAVLRA
jgi:hypothetical protein